MDLPRYGASKYQACLFRQMLKNVVSAGSSAVSNQIVSGLDSKIFNITRFSTIDSKLNLNCGCIKWFISVDIASQVGGIKPGCFKIGNTGGMLDNILASKLYRPGSVAYVSRSGGMSNELNNIISRSTDGVYEGVAIGGDRY